MNKVTRFLIRKKILKIETHIIKSKIRALNTIFNYSMRVRKFKLWIITIDWSLKY